MILELREIYKQSVTTTFSFDESGDSLDADNAEEIKVRERGGRPGVGGENGNAQNLSIYFKNFNSIISINFTNFNFNNHTH